MRVTQKATHRKMHTGGHMQEARATCCGTSAPCQQEAASYTQEATPRVHQGYTKGTHSRSPGGYEEGSIQEATSYTQDTHRIHTGYTQDTPKRHELSAAAPAPVAERHPPDELECARVAARALV